MNNLPEQNDKIERLQKRIKLLQEEVSKEKALRKELETAYEYVKEQYEQALEFINANKPQKSSNSGGGCLFIFILVIILIFLIFYIINIDKQVINNQ